MKIYITIPLIFIAVLLLILALCYITYRKTFYRNPKKEKSDPYAGIDRESVKPYRERSLQLLEGILPLPYEQVETVAEDGTGLYARFYRGKDGGPFIIQCHGYKSTPIRDFSGIGTVGFDEGYNVIMIDHRAHGESGGSCITFGHKEKRDCICWVKYLMERFGSDIEVFLQGLSMGAATVILAAAEKDLPRCVKGVLADCPYSSAKDIIKKVIRGMKLPANILYPFVRLGAIIFGGFDPNKADVAAAAKKAKLPILLIHGDADSFVPYEMGKQVAEASEKVTFHTFGGADHAISYLVDEKRYRYITAEFLRSLASHTHSNER